MRRPACPSPAAKDPPGRPRPPAGLLEPPPDCPCCPRLAHFRLNNRGTLPDGHNDPVPAFGDCSARLLIVGLAPGLKGANRTGRPFTGDFAGDLLYATLIEQGLAMGIYGGRADDGLALVGCRITNAVRCVPPQNKPTPTEITACNQFLAAEVTSLRDLRGILALGRIAHDAVLQSMVLKRNRFPFAHGAIHTIGGELFLADSYHCSRYNTNTGRLTPAMFQTVVAEAARRAALAVARTDTAVAT